VRYVGFDSSAAMLAVFRERIEPPACAELHVADGDGRWPVDDGVAALVFASRAIHHLDSDHVAAETLRVLRPSGGVLAIGRVRRPRDSVKAAMRREMRRLLEAEGVAGRSADAAAGAVFAALERHGAHRLDPIVAARWTVHHSPAESIAAWEAKDGLAGADVAPGLKARVLDHVRQRAIERFGDPVAPLPQEEWFEIASVRLPAR
jgi:SAM-dependent methyltransferase